MAPAFMPTSSSALTPPIPTGSGFGTRTQATRWRYDSARASTTRFTQPEERCAPNAQAASPRARLLVGLGVPAIVLPALQAAGTKAHPGSGYCAAAPPRTLRLPD